MFMITALVLGMMPFMQGAQGEAYAGTGSTISNAKFSKSVIDATLPTKVRFTVKVKDTDPIGSVFVVLSASKKKVKYGDLYFKSGTNKNGIWYGDITFRPGDKGKWKLIFISTSTAARTDYVMRNDKGIGKSITVKAAPKPMLSVSGPGSAVAGNSVKLTATAKMKGKAFALKPLQIKVNYTIGGVKHSTTYKVKTNKKGVATKTIKMPAAASISYSASYAGKRKLAQASKSTIKYVKRKYLTAELDTPTTTWNGASGSEAWFETKLTSGGTPLAGKTVTFVITGATGSISESIEEVTDENGVARVKIDSAPSDQLTCVVSFSDQAYKADAKTALFGLFGPEQTLSLSLDDTTFTTNTAITFTAIVSALPTCSYITTTDPAFRITLYWDKPVGGQENFSDTFVGGTDFTKTVGISAYTGITPVTCRVYAELQYLTSGGGYITVASSNKVDIVIT